MLHHCHLLSLSIYKKMSALQEGSHRWRHKRRSSKHFTFILMDSTIRDKRGHRSAMGSPWICHGSALYRPFEGAVLPNSICINTCHSRHNRHSRHTLDIHASKPLPRPLSLDKPGGLYTAASLVALNGKGSTSLNANLLEEM